MKDVPDFKRYIRDVPDFPKPGIIFKDITTLIKDKHVFEEVIDIISKRHISDEIDKVVGIEARGFILAGAIANRLKVGMIPVRKEGKLPAETYKATYELEYGTDTLELHKDGILKDEKVLIVDDLLATGGTAQAVVSLVRKTGANIIGVDFLIELTFLNGIQKLKDIPVFSLIKY